MKAINVCVLSLVVSVGPALSGTCKNSLPAGGETTSECVRGEELKADAPSLGESKIPSMDQRELDAIKKQMEQPPAVQAAPAVPAR